jgi:hypothetical protein
VVAIKAMYDSARLIRAVIILSSVMRVVARGWAIFGDSQEWVVAVHRDRRERRVQSRTYMVGDGVAWLGECFGHYLVAWVLWLGVGIWRVSEVGLRE